MFQPLSSSFFQRDTQLVAIELLGCILKRRFSDSTVKNYVIVETEAYLGIQDPACHSFKNKRTKRTEAMYLSGGYSYVYLIYGLYYCFNVVTQKENDPQAVLIRALHPLDEYEFPIPKVKIPQKLKFTDGPGKLTRHLQISKSLNKQSLWGSDGPIVIGGGYTLSDQDVVITTRIGVDFAGEAKDWPLRFYVKNNPFVSKK